MWELRRDDSAEGPGGQALPWHEEEVDQAERGRRLLCAACAHPVTDEGAAMEAGGSHHHFVTNPSGVEFGLGCFRRAPGCRLAGAPTREFTWFAGCRWRYALCGGCGEHLGWYYDGAAEFYGLILGRLVPESASPDA